MLKIVYPICCGIDVHKTFVVATISTTDRRNITTYQTKRFSTFTKDLRLLALWLSDNQCVYVCRSPLASTGFLSTKSWNLPARSHWHIRSMSGRFAARKLTKRFRSPHG